MFGRTLINFATHFPRLFAVLEPSLGTSVHSVVLSSVSESVRITRHHGYYPFVNRVLFPLLVPHNCTTTLRIWSSGDSTSPTDIEYELYTPIVFNDMYEHEVITTCRDQKRVVLFLDVFNHELPWIFSLAHRAILMVSSIYNPFLDRLEALHNRYYR